MLLAELLSLVMRLAIRWSDAVVDAVSRVLEFGDAAGNVM